MRKINKYIFICLVTVILFTPVFIKNVMAAHEDAKHESQATSQKHEEVPDTEIKNHGNEATENAANIVHGEESAEQNHPSSHIWPYYGKMIVFSKIMLAFMLFSFVAPLAHFYIKGEKHH